MERSIGRWLLMVVCAGFPACGPKQTSAPASNNAGAIASPPSYEDVSVKALVMTKPDGKHVRTSGAWGGPQPNVAGVPPDAFGVYLFDGATMIALSVPKTIAAGAEAFTYGQAVTVEGRFENRAPFQIVHVDRFVEAAP